MQNTGNNNPFILGIVLLNAMSVLALGLWIGGVLPPLFAAGVLFAICLGLAFLVIVQARRQHHGSKLTQAAAKLENKPGDKPGEQRP